MSKSRFVFDKFAKVLEQGLVSYKDLSDEVINVLKSKRDEIIFRMKLASKEEIEILNKRIAILEKKIEQIQNEVFKISKKKYMEMVNSKYISVLLGMSHKIISSGLNEIKKKYKKQISFQDKLICLVLNR